MLDIGALYVEHSPTITRYISRHLQGADPAVIEDLVSDVFERALRAAPNYQERGVPAQAWLMTIARNLVADRFRDRRRRVTIVRLGDVVPVVGDHAASVIDRLDAREHVARALPRLTPGQRAVMYCRYLADLSIRDAARATGRSEDAVKTLQRSGLRNLRRRIEMA